MDTKDNVRSGRRSLKHCIAPAWVSLYFVVCEGVIRYTWGLDSSGRVCVRKLVIFRKATKDIYSGFLPMVINIKHLLWPLIFMSRSYYIGLFFLEDHMGFAAKSTGDFQGRLESCIKRQG